jgi:nucleoside-diphosphate-sugar epimerase
MMRVLLAGATGAIGHSLTPALVAAGHSVHGTTRSTTHAAALERAGATPVVMDGLDRDSVLRAVEDAKPDVIIHQLTALKGGLNPKHFDRDFAVTNRLRTEATRYLLEAARLNGVSRFIAQSYTGWTNERTGASGPDDLADESTPLDPHPGREARESLEAIRWLESTVPAMPDLDGIVLRYGGFYGPGTGIARGDESEMVELITKRRLPIVGSGAGLWSFIHAVDAASATVAAVERGEPGLFNIVDDEPVAVADWLPALARELGAKPPRHLPAWLARPLIGEHGVNTMTNARGSSNAKAKRELGWVLQYPTWRVGFTEGL